MHTKLLVGACDHSIGPLDASITLVEYGNYECSHYRSVAQVLRTLQTEFDGQIRRIFRHFPHVTMHSLSLLAAEAAEAAASQGKFWQMHEALLARRDSLSEGTLLASATAVGLNLPQFLSDLEEHVYQERVLQDFRSGIENGVVSTPTLFINGLRYEDVAEIDVLRAAMLASILQKTGECGKFQATSPTGVYFEDPEAALHQSAPELKAHNEQLRAINPETGTGYRSHARYH